MKSKKEKCHSRLTIWVISILLFELISGLIIYLACFSLTAQALVVIHTALGLIMVIPYIIYQAKHWYAYRKNKLTQHKLLGYLSMATALVAAFSGIFLSYEAIFQTRINYFWDQVHILATFGFLLSVIPHIGLLIIRDFRAIKEKKTNQLIGLMVQNGKVENLTTILYHY